MIQKYFANKKIFKRFMVLKTLIVSGIDLVFLFGSELEMKTLLYLTNQMIVFYSCLERHGTVLSMFMKSFSDPWFQRYNAKTESLVLGHPVS